MVIQFPYVYEKKEQSAPGLRLMDLNRQKD